MRKILIALIVVLAASMNSWAASIFPENVEAPLPGKQTALLVAFTDANETSVVGGVPQCTTLGCSFMGQLAAKFTKRRYTDVQTMVASRFNQLPPQSGQGYFTVDDFRNQITGSNAGRYGVFVSYGHAGSLNGGIAVENYPSETTPEEVQQRVNDLINTPRYTDGDIFAFTPGPTEQVVAVTKDFIASQARFADRSYAFAYGCKTFSAFNRNGGNDPATADITFLDPAVGGVYFVGIKTLCPANNTVYFSYLSKMLGDTPIGSNHSNYTVKQALDDDSSTLLVARSRNNDISVNRMRLWNREKILKGEIKQGGTDIYQYAYADQIFPFNQAPYPGDLSQAALRPAGAGEIVAKFTFSGPMDSTWSGFKVKLVPPGSGAALDFTTDAWTQTNYSNDTWTGRVTIPSSGSDWEGIVTVSVAARDASQDSDDLGGTLDTDGDGTADGPDSSVSFTLQRVRPKITFSDSAGKFTITATNGMHQYEISTPGTGGQFFISGEGSPLESVTLEKNGVEQNHLLSPSFTPGMAEYSGSITGGASGSYTYSLSAKNADPTTTELNWPVATVDMSLADTQCIYDPETRKFELTVQMNLDAAAGGKTMHSYMLFDPNVTTSASPREQYTSADFSDLALSAGSSVYWQEPGLTGRSFVLADNNDATTQLDLRFSLGAVGVHGGGWTTTQSSEKFETTIATSIFLPGAVQPVGTHIDPLTGEVKEVDGAAAQVLEIGSAAGPAISVQEIGTYSVELQTWNEGEGETTCALASGSARFIRNVGLQITKTNNNGYCTYKKFYKYVGTLTTEAQTSFATCPGTETFCETGRKYAFAVGPNGGTIDGGGQIFGVIFSSHSFLGEQGRFFPGQTTLKLGTGFSLAGMNPSVQGAVSIAFPKATGIPGYRDLLGGSLLQLNGNIEEVGGPFQLKVTYGDSGLTDSEEQRAKVFTFPSLCTRQPQAVAINAASNEAVISATRFGHFQLVSSEFENEVVAGGSAFRVTSNAPAVTIAAGSGNPNLAQLLSVQRSLGRAPLGAAYDVGPSGQTFNPPLLIEASYSEEDETQAGTVANNLLQLRSSDGSQPNPPLSVTVDTQCRRVSARVAELSSLFGIFGATTSIPASDLLSPITTLSLDGHAAPPGSFFILSTTSTFSLSATDQFFPGAPVSGVESTRVLIDGVFASTVASPGQLYAGPFSLSVGSHTIVIYSSDFAGNVETPRVIDVLVNQPPSRGIGGLGIGRDASNRLWTVALDGESLALARTNDDGIAVASASLPNALPDVQWGVLFDDSGSAYAVGTAGGPSTMAADLAIYKASMDGNSIVASQIFDSGFANNDIIFDVAAPGWIAGGVQVSGPADLEAPGERVFKAALWRFDTSEGSVTLSTTFAQGAALGVSVDGDGTVWVAGFVENPLPRSSRALDLGLWHFAADGQTVLAGPFLREAFAEELSLNFATKILISASAVTIVAPRGRPGDGTDLGSVRFDKSSGVVLAESAWRAADGSGAYPAALMTDGSGALAAGGLDLGDTRGALWRYGADGSFTAASIVAAGGARGAVVRNSELWLAVDNATTPYKVTGESASPGALADIQPPRVELIATSPSFVSGNTLFVTSTSLLSFASIDDKLAVGDALGAGGGGVQFVFDSTGPFAAFTSAFALASEGLSTATFYGTDAADNPGPMLTRLIGVDRTEPAAMLVSSGSLYAVVAEDPLIGGAASGVAEIQHLIDVDPETCGEVMIDTAAALGTCANFSYVGPFFLSAGTHTVLFKVSDNLGNGSETIHSSYVVVAAEGGGAPFVLSPSSGPIGVPFTISGAGFGAFGGSNTRVKFGTVISPVSVWNDTTIVGTIPGLSTGAYEVAVERQHASSVTTVSAGVFAVVSLDPQSISASSGPIGMPFTITGAGFGPYAGSNSRVMVGITTATVSVWNDTTITGTIPGVASGETDIYLVRTTSDGGRSESEHAPFTVTSPSVATISPSSGPIGAAFALSGVSFGPYAGSNSVVLIGGAAASVSVWNDAAIVGTVPGALLPGVHEVLVERRTADGGLARANTVYFEVTGLGLSSINPSNGPIGVPFSIQGAGFGAYGGGNTRVKFGDTVASVSLWNNTTINGTVPPLSTGAWTVVVERQQGANISQSNVSSFTLTALEIATLTPSSGSIGAPFTITGAGYGPYAGSNSRVLIGGATASVSVWNDATISGTIPALPAGPHAVRLERVSGAGIQTSGQAALLVVDPAIAAMSPSSGPIGIPFTVTGAGFGPYGGSNTVLLIGGSTATVSLWNDTTIKGTVPGSLPTGLKSVVVKRIATGGSATSNAAEFSVTGMSLNAVNPSSGPIGAPFTITGTQFGTYGGSNTRVRMGGVVTAVSVWNDTTITGTIPNLTPGLVDLVVERQQGASTALSNVSSFTVVGASPTGLTPETGPIGTAFTITGSGFGPYGGSNTRVLVAGLTASVSLWNDTTIKGTIPAAAPGEQPIWIERQLGAAVQSSDTAYFTITVPSVASLTPSSAPIGAPFTLTGASFGVYGGANTRVKFNGVVAPVSVWNDTTITGTVPGVLTPGEVELVVERAVGAGLSSSATQAFLVLLPTVSTITPGYGPVGTVVTLTGVGFGPYGGSLTRVLVGGATTAVSVWNDKTIRWTVPASLADGEYPVVVRRSPVGGTVDSEPVNFTVGAGYGTSSFGFAQTMSLASTPDSHFEGDLALSSTTGGRIDTPAKAAVEIPPNAMEEDTSITVKRAHSDGLRNDAAEDIKKRAAGEPIEFGPEGTRFATPVTIELPYDPALISDETKIAIHYFNPLRREWEELASVVDRTRKVVSAKTDHFSIYQPMGLAPTAASQDEFYFRDAYAFPNPSRGGALVTFRLQPGLAETIELRVYDLSGRKVHESTDFTFRGAFDDGNGKGAQNTYDHTWGVSGVASGVYTFVMKASQRGNKPIVKSGKVGVIK